MITACDSYYNSLIDSVKTVLSAQVNKIFLPA